MIKPGARLEEAWVEEARNSQRLFFISKELQLNTKFHYIEVTATSENYKITLCVSKITVTRKSFFTSAYTLSRQKTQNITRKGKRKRRRESAKEKEKQRECEREGERETEEEKEKEKEKKRECEREGEREREEEKEKEKGKEEKKEEKKKTEKAVLKVFSSTPPPPDMFPSTVPSLDIAREQHNSRKGRNREKHNSYKQ